MPMTWQLFWHPNEMLKQTIQNNNNYNKNDNNTCINKNKNINHYAVNKYVWPKPVQSTYSKSKRCLASLPGLH